MCCSTTSPFLLQLFVSVSLIRTLSPSFLPLMVLLFALYIYIYIYIYIHIYYNECLGNLISNKSVKHNTINSRECLSLPKDDSNNHDDSNNDDDTISHGNTVSHDDTCVPKEDFNSCQVKCIKELQNVKDAFLKKLSDIEQNLEKNLEKKEYDEE